MNDQTTEKFAALLANCAVNGQADELRKEAAAHELVKEAISPWLVAGPLAGLAAGGAAGYFGTDDEKRKKRNALYGALSGGLLGLGVPLMAGAGQLTGGNMAGAGGTPAAGDKGAPKPSGVLGARDVVPKALQPALLMPEDSKSPFVPGNVTDPENPQYGYSWNWHNWPARLLGLEGGRRLGKYVGGGAGTGLGHLADRRANSAATQRAILTAALQNPARGKKQNPNPKPTWRDDASGILNKVRHTAGDKSSLFDLVRRAFGGVPKSFTQAANDAVGLRPWQRPPQKPKTPAQKARYNAAREKFKSDQGAARELARAAYTGEAPKSQSATDKLYAALKGALTQAQNQQTAAGQPKPKPPKFVSPEDFSAATRRGPGGALPNGLKPNTPRTTGRTIGGRAGRAVGGWGGGLGGAYLMNPETSQRFLDYFLGAPAARAEAERLKAEQSKQ